MAFVLPDKPDLGLLLANRRTESTFEEIPVMLGSLSIPVR
jgi:hypothetical protein